ncbi:hypothetical protein FNV43_RR03587 [Rhamnella rubrinervis]|uniref:Golgi apparatus membrane protein TVP23 n=1 Tax=Rhamnella rubrinervis TaxID=2594499 RepID=A0A8K0HI00_9ROSA|nr:hypothetical protein FNV43_RR03587 [Rhamnella rubrinervis]
MIASAASFVQAGALAFYILSALFFDNFVIIFVVTVLLAALDFGHWPDEQERFMAILVDTLPHSKYILLDYRLLLHGCVLGIFSLIRFQADYLLVIGVSLTLSIANIVGFTKCRKDAKKQIQQFASQTIASRFSSTIQSAFSVV